MPLNNINQSKVARVTSFVARMTQAYQYIKLLTTQIAKEVYADPETAQEYVKAMNAAGAAALIFEASGIAGEAINGWAPIFGDDPIQILPDGYTVDVNADGTVTLDYTDEYGSGNSSSSEEPPRPTPTPPAKPAVEPQKPQNVSQVAPAPKVAAEAKPTPVAAKAPASAPVQPKAEPVKAATPAAPTK